jgi:hypothetical protein
MPKDRARPSSQAFMTVSAEQHFEPETFMNHPGIMKIQESFMIFIEISL